MVTKASNAAAKSEESQVNLTDMDESLMGTFTPPSVNAGNDEWNEDSNAANESVANNNGDHEIEDEEINQHHHEEEDPEEKPAKKGMSTLLKILLWTIGIAIAGVGGLVGYALLTATPPKPEVTMEPQVQPIKTAEGNPVTVAPTPAAPPVEEPGGYDPTKGPAVTSPAMPAADPLATQTVNAAPANTPVAPAFNANNVAPAAAPAINTASVAPVGPVAPVNANTPASTTAPAIQPAVATPAVTTPAAANGLTNTAYSANPTIAAMEKEQNDRLTKLENQLSEITVLLKKMDSQASNQVSQKVEVSNPEPVKVVRKPAPKKPRVVAEKEVVAKPVIAADVKAKPAPDFNTNKPEAIGKTVSVPAATTQPTEYAVPVAKPASRPLLVAIVPGRAFLQNTEGVRSDIAVGDHVPSCGNVIRIDAEASEVVTEKCVIK